MNYLMINIPIIVFVFFITLYIAYWWTEKNKHYPAFLDYKPWNCRTCFTFWLQLFTYIGLSLILNNFFYMAGLILVVLNTIALLVDEKHKIN